MRSPLLLVENKPILRIASAAARQSSRGMEGVMMLRTIDRPATLVDESGLVAESHGERITA